MSLRELASADLRTILEDDTAGFGWPITVTNSAGVYGELVGSSNDIGQAIDPETGLLVSGRTASVVLTLASLTEHDLSAPVGVSDAAQKPWVVEFNDIAGKAYRFKVVSTAPDNTLGVVVCMLESYTE